MHSFLFTKKTAYVSIR